MSYHGKYNPKNPSKYKGNPGGIVFRSLWERRMMDYLDNNLNVLEWGSEEFSILYYNPIKKKTSRYFPDFYAKIKTAYGTIETVVIEIKPDIQTRPPVKPVDGKYPRRYKKACVDYVINQAKWEAAKKVCEEAGVRFVVMTEHDLGISRKPRQKTT